MRDRYLASIIASVENGGEPVAISVALHSGAVVSGFVRHSEFFVRVTKNESRRIRQLAAGKKDDAYQEGLLLQQERIHSIYADEDPGDSEAITLSDVTMLWQNGAGLRLKTIRLSPDAIAVWWVARGEPIKPPKDSGGFWAVGVTF